MSHDELRDWLHLLSCVSRGAARRLLARHGAPGAVLRAGRGRLGRRTCSGGSHAAGERPGPA